MGRLKGILYLAMNLAAIFAWLYFAIRAIG